MLKAVQVGRFGGGKRVLALVCLLLTLTAAVAEATHLHLDAKASNSPIRCSICVAAHSAKPVPNCQPLHAVTVFAAIAVQQIPLAGSRIAVADLLVRPPPFSS
jgi:hypothetical protein